MAAAAAAACLASPPPSLLHRRRPKRMTKTYNAKTVQNEFDDTIHFEIGVQIAESETDSGGRRLGVIRSISRFLKGVKSCTQLFIADLWLQYKKPFTSAEAIAQYRGADDS